MGWKMTNIIYFFRYTIVGYCATLCHYTILIVLVETHFATAALASAIGAFAGAGLGYIGNAHFTFNHHTSLSIEQFVRFSLIALLSVLLNTSIVFISTALNINYLLGQLLATFAVLPLTFFINKQWTFDL